MLTGGEGAKSDPGNIDERVAGRGQGGGSPPLLMGVRGCNLQTLFLTSEMLYTSFITYFVVKFKLLVVAFKVFLEKK